MKDVFKTYSRRLYRDECLLDDTSSILLEDVSKTSWRHFQGITSSWRLAKMFSEHLQDVFFETFSRRCPDVFKRHHKVKQFSLTRLHDIFNTFLRWAALLRNLLWGYKFSKSFDIRFWDTEVCKTDFLKHFMKWFLLQIKIFLLKSGIRKNVTVLVNKKSMNM